jgi:drug/metabolite transporter (DMT)-like permease
MALNRVTWATFGSTASFVLLWSSGAIVSRIGVDHLPAFVFLSLRFALAGVVLAAIGMARGSGLPLRGTRGYIVITGLLMIGGYTGCYFLALSHGITPGVLAVVLGVQPILTLVLLERRYPLPRLLGLVVSLCGLALVAYQGIVVSRFSARGMLFALGALASATAGAILQKRITQPPAVVLPLQYAACLLLFVLLWRLTVPAGAFRFDGSAGLLISLVWMALVVSVAAQLLLYRLIRAGNLVNVTSLFYLVPVVTAAMDYLFLGDRMSVPGLSGMGAILAGLVLVFRSGQAPTAQPQPASARMRPTGEVR